MTLIKLYQTSTKLMVIFLVYFSDKLDAEQELICKDLDRNSRLDGIIELKNSTKLIFKSSRVWIIDPSMKLCEKSYIKDLIDDEELADGFDAIAYYPRNQMYFVFKSEKFWGIRLISEKLTIVHKRKDANRYLKARIVNHVGHYHRIDGLFILINPDYDSFTQYDYLYLFEGQRITVYGLYFFAGELIFTNLNLRLKRHPQIHRITDKYFDSIDSAFIDQNFVYLFKDNLQYRIEAQEFRHPFAKSMNNTKVVVEKQLTGFVENKSSTLTDRFILWTLFVVKSVPKVFDSTQPIHNHILKIFIFSVLLSIVICIFVFVHKMAKLYLKNSLKIL